MGANIIGSLIPGAPPEDRALRPRSWKDQIGMDSEAQLGATAGAQQINYKPQGQSDYYIFGIFKRITIAQDVETGREITKAVILAATTSLPRSSQGDSVVVDGTLYKIIGNNPDGNGMTTLTLSLDANA